MIQQLYRKSSKVNSYLQDNGMFVNSNFKIAYTLFDFLYIYRLVNDLLKGEMTKIHAFSQKTYTPDEWEKKQQKSAANPESEAKSSNACAGLCGNSKN